MMLARYTTRIQFSPILYICVGVLLVALAVRWHQMDAVLVLQDAVGPFWAALRMDGRTHAEPYGTLMLLPYAMTLMVAQHLWGAMHWMGFWHSLAAPVTSLVMHGIRPGNRWLSLVAGLLVAVDPGLNDTFLSGAESYLAPLFLGLVTVVRGGWAWLLFAFAVANHPLSLVGAPLLVRRSNFQRKALWMFLPALVFMALQVSGWGRPGVANDAHSVVDAVRSYFSTGTFSAVVIAAGPFLALCFHAGRKTAVPVLASMGLLLLAGHGLGYLRDHHLRLLTIPALACWAALPGRAWFFLLPGLLGLFVQQRPPESGFRGSTLALVSHLGRQVAELPAPMMVDRVWMSGGPAVEPSALMLDLHLRGWGPITPGSSMVVVLAAENEDRTDVSIPGSILMDGHGYTIAHMKTVDAYDWSQQFCLTDTRFGGAWDALSVLDPDSTTESVSLWWACP